MLLQVERVVLNALGRIRLWSPTFARPANHWPSSSGQADPPWRTKNSVRRCTERKNSRTRTGLGVAVLAAANASTTTFGASRSDFLSCEESCWNFFCWLVTFDCPITAESWAAICCPPSTASAQVGKSSRSPLHRAAAYPLHPLH